MGSYSFLGELSL